MGCACGVHDAVVHESQVHITLHGRGGAVDGGGFDVRRGRSAEVAEAE